MPSDGEGKAACGLARMEMLRRSLRRGDVARMSGLTAPTVSNVLAGWNVSLRERRKIELALGAPFWTPTVEFRSRLALMRFYGFDPALMTLQELDAQAALHLPGFDRKRPIRPRSELIHQLETAFTNRRESGAAANP